MKIQHPAHQAVEIINQLKPDFKPRVGIVLGSGLGSLAAHIEDPTVISYEELPGFPRPSIEGHAGKIVLGYLNKVPVVCLQGRAHFYEGNTTEQVKNYVRTVKLLGCEIYLATNAVGSLHANITPGNLVMIADHINFQPGNPLVGINDGDFGPRFIGMENAYDPTLRTLLKCTAEEKNIPLFEGVYIAVTGPMFETPAEIRAYRILGADVVGMSTVPEVIIARHCGLKVAVISAVTNLAAGMSDEILTHEGTLQYAQLSTEKMINLIKGFMGHLS